MAAPNVFNPPGLAGDAKCFAFVRQQPWPEDVRCPD